MRTAIGCIHRLNEITLNTSIWKMVMTVRANRTEPTQFTLKIQIS